MEPARTASSPRSPSVLLHVHDAKPSPPSRSLDGRWMALAVSVHRLETLRAGRSRDCLFDVDLSAPGVLPRVRDFVSALAPGGSRIFVCSRGSQAAKDAAALGATGLITEPLSDGAVLRLLGSDEPPIDDERDPARGPRPGGRAPKDSAALGATEPVTAPLSEEAVLRLLGSDEPPIPERDPIRKAVSVGSLALDLSFRAILEGGPLAADDVGEIAGSLSESVAEVGIASWLDSIRAHHSGTYQHCMIVTGLASAFGQELGFSEADLATLTVAALMHDIGKAKVDVAILDKPGRLTEDEMAQIRMHPVWGDEYLRGQEGFSETVRDVVRHHHEFLDGSGYPDGLSGGQITDLTRLVTIADVFGALIERRSYKPPMASDDALAILRSMAAAGKMETALVECFGRVAAKLPLPS